jgi:hypothetical protein
VVYTYWLGFVTQSKHTKLLSSHLKTELRVNKNIRCRYHSGATLVSRLLHNCTCDISALANLSAVGIFNFDHQYINHHLLEINGFKNHWLGSFNIQGKEMYLFPFKKVFENWTQTSAWNINHGFPFIEFGLAFESRIGQRVFIKFDCPIGLFVFCQAGWGKAHAMRMWAILDSPFICNWLSLNQKLLPSQANIIESCIRFLRTIISTSSM